MSHLSNRSGAWSGGMSAIIEIYIFSEKLVLPLCKWIFTFPPLCWRRFCSTLLEICALLLDEYVSSKINAAPKLKLLCVTLRMHLRADWPSGAGWLTRSGSEPPRCPEIWGRPSHISAASLASSPGGFWWWSSLRISPEGRPGSRSSHPPTVCTASASGRSWISWQFWGTDNRTMSF